MFVKWKALLILSVIVVIYLNGMSQDSRKSYFTSPKQSVDVCIKLIKEDKFKELASYYYLEKADLETIKSINNGSYFINTEKPEVIHPAIPWKYKKPFSPNFKFINSIQISADSVRVEVGVKIDQGDEFLQQGYSSFYLIKLNKGYQLLP